MGAGRSLTLRTHQAVPRDRGEEDRSSCAPPGGSVRAPVRQDPHTPALPRPCYS